MKLQEYNELNRLRSELLLSVDIDKRLQEIREALQRMEDGKIHKIVIYKKGPIQES